MRNFIIGRPLKESNPRKQKCLRKYNAFGRANYFLRCPDRFPQRPVNFATIHPKPQENPGDTIETLKVKRL